jgi:hypothetical protein
MLESPAQLRDASGTAAELRAKAHLGLTPTAFRAELIYSTQLLSQIIRIGRMYQYWVDNLVDGIAVHYLMLAQFNVHARAQNTYSGPNIRTLKHVFQ